MKGCVGLTLNSLKAEHSAQDHGYFGLRGLETTVFHLRGSDLVCVHRQHANHFGY